MSDWMVFDSIEPIGGRRGDIQAAIVAATFANANRGKGDPFTVSDFIPDWLGERNTELAKSPEELLEKVREYAGKFPAVTK